MFALKIIFLFGIIFVIISILYAINEFSKQKFNYKLYSKSYFIAGLFLLGGKKAYEYAIANNGDILNGYVLIGVGFIIILIKSIHLFMKTNLLFGTIGTALNILLFCMGAKYILIFIAIVVCFWLLLAILEDNRTIIYY